MILEVGQTVVYPHHGAATIKAMTIRTIKGVERQYLTLEVHQSELSIEVPVENLEMVGVRDVIDTIGIDAVFEVLSQDSADEPGNWARRFKANAEKMGSGNVLSVCEVVRDLTLRDHDRGVSAGEKRMLLKAKQILVSELALAQQSTNVEAEAAIDKVLEGAVAAAAAKAKAEEGAAATSEAAAEQGEIKATASVAAV